MLGCLWIVSNVKNATGIGDKINTKMNSYRLSVRVGNYIYTVDVWQLFSGKWYASFKNPDIDSFEQVDKVTKQDVIEYIHEEYPERV